MEYTLNNLSGTDLTVILFALRNYEAKLNQALDECEFAECRSRHITNLRHTEKLYENVDFLLKQIAGAHYAKSTK